jgi:hypothetical protein
MSGGGLIIEKTRVLIEHARDVVRYRVVDRKASRDEYIMAVPAQSEPSVGDTVWWSADWIYFGLNDSGRLTRVGPCWDATG